MEKLTLILKLYYKVVTIVLNKSTKTLAVVAGFIALLLCLPILICLNTSEEIQELISEIKD
jgi:hypothetical protein